MAGWLYCEGTAINYPVMQGPDNDRYLHRSLDGSYNAAGSLFVEAANRPGFQDGNTIIYGHHMRNGSMFAELENWSDPAYYEAHPVMWLLTPEQDYKLQLLAGYTTAAGSEAYSVFTEPGPEVEAYIGAAAAASDFTAGFTPAENSRYVMLSTCAYVFEQARYVLHGVLIPVGGAAD